MAAQKLTKGRLVQIVVMMLILIAAFTWRTATYDNIKTANCIINTSCTISIGNGHILVSNHHLGFLIETSESHSFEIEATGASEKIDKLSPNSWVLITQDIAPTISVTSTQQAGSVSIKITKPESNDK